MHGQESLLLVVDMQKDFCPGGALGVPGGDGIIPRINEIMTWFHERSVPVLLSRDWHPEKTVHFREMGGPWPPHCIQETEGAQFCEGLAVPGDAAVLSKGLRPDRDDYSAYEAVTEDGVRLPELMNRRRIRTLFIVGMATDYCVRATALDALNGGYEVIVFSDGIRGVSPDSSREAIETIRRRGGHVLSFSEFRRSRKS